MVNVIKNNKLKRAAFKVAFFLYIYTLYIYIYITNKAPLYILNTKHITDS